MTNDLSARLRAAADHFDHHPHLAEDNCDVSVARHLRVQVYRDSAHLAAFAAWAPTFLNPPPMVTVNIHPDGETVSLTMRGRLVDGTPVEVVCLPDEHEVDLLAANTPIVKGATFDVDLLLRLTSAPAAEERTCAFPGDQEHDHRVCEDVVADEAAAAEHTVTPMPNAWTELTPGTLIDADVAGTVNGKPVTRTIRRLIDRAPWGYDPARGTYVISDGVRVDVVLADSVRIVDQAPAAEAVRA